MGVFADYAQKYFEAGYSVIPVNGQAPIIDEWNKYCEQKITQEELDIFIEKYGNMNIGIALGSASGIVAFDFDFKGQDSDLIEKFILELLPPSPVRKYGSRGWTAFYKYNNEKSYKIDRSNGRMVDLLSTDRQTVIPPSLHPKVKKPYKWITLDTLLDVRSSELPILPSDLKEKLEQLSNMDIRGKDSVYTEKSGRHDKICTYGWAIIEKSTSLEDFAIKLIEYDKTQHKDEPYFEDSKYFRGKSPIDAATSIAKRIEKTVITSKAKRNIKWKIGAKNNTQNNNSETNKYNSDLDLFLKMSTPYYETVVYKNGAIKDYPKYNELAVDLKRENIFKCSDAGNYIYNNGFWRFIDKTEFHNIINKINDNQCSPNHLDSFLKIIKAVCFYDSANHDDSNEHSLINLKNGIYDIKNKKLIEHSSKYFFRQILPIEYKPNEKCDQWLQFLNYVLKGDKELIKLIQQLFGYVLIGGDPFLHKAFVLYGSGRNGKSTLIDILRSLIGVKSYSTVSMSKINKEFSAVALVGKLANIVEETPDEEINSEVFKSIVGGGSIQVSHKNFDEFTAKINARFIFACNDMPIFKDKNSSMLDRLVFIPFSVYIEEKDRDTRILEKLNKELSGILNWAIVGANEIIENRKMLTPGATVELKEQYKEETDSVYAWCIEMVKVLNLEDYSDENYKPRIYTNSEIYKYYEQWCGSSGVYAVKMMKFSKRFASWVKTKDNLCDGSKTFKVNDSLGHKVIRGYNNLRINYDIPNNL